MERTDVVDSDYRRRYRPPATRKAPVVREFLKGAVRLHILHHASQGEVHGAWMSRELAHHGYTISPGTLYPTLHRMEAEGLLTSQQRVVDGRTRRVYHATPAGHEALAADRTALAELAHEVLDTPHSAPLEHAADDGTHR
jgi:DNA-binding PadR family transcriptional regulator